MTFLFLWLWLWLWLWSGKNLTKGEICTCHSDSHAGAQVWYSVHHPIEEVQEQEGYSRSPWALPLVKYLQLPRHLLWSLNFCATHESWRIKLLLAKLAANYTKWTQYSTHKVNIKIFLSWGTVDLLVTLGQNLKFWILIWELGSHQWLNGKAHGPPPVPDLACMVTEVQLQPVAVVRRALLAKAIGRCSKTSLLHNLVWGY